MYPSNRVCYWDYSSCRLCNSSKIAPNLWVIPKFWVIPISSIDNVDDIVSDVLTILPWSSHYFFDFLALEYAIATACFTFACFGVIPSFLARVFIAFARDFHGFSDTSFDMFFEIVFWDFHLERDIVVMVMSYFLGFLDLQGMGI